MAIVKVVKDKERKTGKKRLHSISAASKAKLSTRPGDLFLFEIRSEG